MGPMPAVFVFGALALVAAKPPNIIFCKCYASHLSPTKNHPVREKKKQPPKPPR